MMIHASSGHGAMSCEKQIDENLELVGGIRGRVQALKESAVAARYDLRCGRRYLPRQHGNIRSHQRLVLYRCDLRCLRGPLLGERRLSVACTGNASIRTGARQRSSARINLGRSRMRRRRSRGLGKPAMSLTDEITAGSFIREKRAPAGAGEKQRAPGAVRPPVADGAHRGFRKRVLACQDPERDRDLSAPAHTQLRAQRVRMRLRGAGRDAEPLTDLVVRAPAAISATTSRCLGVRPVPLWNVIVIMASEASAPSSAVTITPRVYRRCNFAGSRELPLCDDAWVITEQAVLDVEPGREAEFEVAFAHAKRSSPRAPGSLPSSCCAASRPRAAMSCSSRGRPSRITRRGSGIHPATRNGRPPPSLLRPVPDRRALRGGHAPSWADRDELFDDIGERLGGVDLVRALDGEAARPLRCAG